jgi:hypothetical protein
VNRALKRKIEEEIQRSIYADRCSLCLRPFERDDETYGGGTRNGAAAYVGNCCVARLTNVVVFGLKIE